MNSAGKVLTNFEWKYEGPIKIMRGKGYQGKGVSRTMFLTPKLEDIPVELFALKISQSTNPAKTGKPTFRYFNFRFDPNAKYEDMAPTGIDLTTPLEEIKATVITKFGNIPNAEISVNVHLAGKFTNVTCADGVFAIYDEDKFPNADPDRAGNAPYYLKSDAIMNVALKGAVSQGNEYLQSTISTTAISNDVFQKSQTGKVWGEEEGVSAGTPTTPAAGAPTPTGAPVW